MDKRHFDPDRLKRLRQSRGETQEQVAIALNVNRQTIYRAEAGNGIPYELLCDLAAHYGVPVVSFLHPVPIPVKAETQAA